MKHLIPIAFLAACAQRPAPATPVDAELAGHRAQMLGYLAEYTERGEFPTDDNGLPISVFKDSHGVRCPMAELIYRSGHPELVDAIAAEDNHARLGDITDGPIHDWMVGSGLTHDEIVMIQGAADLSNIRFEPRELIQPKREIITAQRERVRGRLEMAQTALRKDLRTSLQAASNALPQHRVPAIRTARPVLARH